MDLTVILVMLVMASSCKDRLKEEQMVSIPAVHFSVAPDKDGVIRDVPASEKSDELHRLSRMLMNRFHLSNLENGFDGLEVRVVSTKNGLDAKYKMVVLQNKGVEWKSWLYNFEYIYNASTRRYDTLSGNQAVLPPPKSGWKKFAEGLIRQDILTLPDYETLPSYSLGPDEGAAAVEIGMNNLHRLYRYPTPTARVKEYPEAKKMVGILGYIATEFDLDSF